MKPISTGFYAYTKFSRRNHTKVLFGSTIHGKMFFKCTKSLGEINTIYSGQKLGIHAELKDPEFQNYPILSDHDINLKITCLSLNFSLGWFINSCVDLDNFPKLETFYGHDCEITVDYAHPSLKNLYLDEVTFSTLPVNLIKLEALVCRIRMKEDHPRLSSLTMLVLGGMQEPIDVSSLLRILWNKDLEHFGYLDEGGTKMNEIYSMIGPKMTHFEFQGSFSSRIPTLLRSLELYVVSRGLINLTDYTHMSSLTLEAPSGNIDGLKFPPNLLRLSVLFAKFKNLAKVDFPPKIVDLELECCEITLTAGWLKPARLKRLSLASNALSSFEAFLPCCEFLNLSDNKLKKVKIEAPVLRLINLNINVLTAIPKLPARLQVLILSNNKLDLSQMSELPSNLKVLDLLDAGPEAPQNYTFPSSIQELHLTRLCLSGMSGVKFARDSKLKELNLSCSCLSRLDNEMIKLPLGLKSLDLSGNHLLNLDKLTIPQTVTSLNLRDNGFKSLKVMPHIETLYLSQNYLTSLTIPMDLELRFLDLTLTRFEKYLFDLSKGEKLTQVRLGDLFFMY